MNNSVNEKLALKVSYITIGLNMALALFKFAAGVMANSAAMVSDAVNSASDVLSTFAVVIGVKIASKEADADHPYGHERFENIAAIILSALLCATGVGIGYSSVLKIIGATENEPVIPGFFALIAAIVTLVVKEAMYWYTRNAAKKINSSALMAIAWDNRSDVFLSIGSFIGILGARVGFPVLDPLAGVVICVFIVKVAISIFMDSVNKVTDKACDMETVEKIKAIAERNKDLIAVDSLKTRMFANKIYVDMEILADGEKSLAEAHGIAQNIHDEIEREIPLVKHCMIHVNPFDYRDENKTEDLDKKVL